MITINLLYILGLFLAFSSQAMSCEDDRSHLEEPPEYLRSISPFTTPTLRYLPNNKLHITISYDMNTTAGHNSSDIIYDLFNIDLNLIFFPDWSPYPPLTENITVVTIKNWKGDVHKRQWNDPDRVLQVLSNVEEVYWDGPGAISEPSLQVLERRSEPKAKLFYQLKTYDAESSLPHRALINSTNLHSLDAILRYSYYRDEESLPFIFTLLQTCPNLKELSIKIYENSCEVSNSDFGFDFASPPNITLSPLEVLRVDGYGLDTFEDGGSDWMRRREQLALEPNRQLATNLEAWKRVMDFSKLNTLELMGADEKTLNSLGGNLLTGLKHLSITGWGLDTGAGEQQTTRKFVRELKNPLESLKVNSWKADLEDVVDVVTEYHCSTLKDFKFGERVALPSPALDRLFATCKSLQKLDISVPWPNTTFSYPKLENGIPSPEWSPYLLAIPMKSPKINHLAIHFPSPPDREYTPDAPNEYTMPQKEWDATPWGQERLRQRGKISDIMDEVFNKHTILDLFKKLRVRNVEGPLRNGEIFGLQSLHVFMGDWEIREAELGGFMGRGYRIRVAFYECSVDHFGNEMCEGSQTRSVEYGGDQMDYIS